MADESVIRTARCLLWLGVGMLVGDYLRWTWRMLA